MAAIKSFPSVIWIRLLIVGAGLIAIGRLTGIVIESLGGGSAPFKSKLIARLTTSAAQELFFTFARAFVPNLDIRHKLITAYDNSGTVLVTRFADVKDVLSRDQDFEVVYRPRMQEITGGHNFFLGMQDTPRYTQDVSNMRLCVRRDDLPNILQPFVGARAAELVKALPGKIDVPQDLTLRVPAELLSNYFGIPGPSERDMIAWTTLMFWYLFIDLAADSTVATNALAAATQCRAYLDTLIEDRKTHPTQADDVLNRCLALQRAGLPGMDDLGIRNNLIGLIIGAVPTLSMAAVQALDQLLKRPDALAAAQLAARADEDALLARYVFEALRFNPVNPVIYRRATHDTVIAPNTLRATTVTRSTMVLAANLSAMFDRLKVEDPNSFRIDRPGDNYILWGDGLHTCFGVHINQVILPAILKPLLQRQELRRVPGSAGQIDRAGTPFPAHMYLEFMAQ